MVNQLAVVVLLLVVSLHRFFEADLKVCLFHPIYMVKCVCQFVQFVYFSRSFCANVFSHIVWNVVGTLCRFLSLEICDHFMVIYMWKFSPFVLFYVEIFETDKVWLSSS